MCNNSCSPPPLYDDKSNYSAIQCDIVIKGTFELDFTCPKDTVSHAAPHALGEIWDDTVDSTVCQFGEYVLREYAKGRAGWVTGAEQYIQNANLTRLEKKQYLRSILFMDQRIRELNIRYLVLMLNYVFDPCIVYKIHIVLENHKITLQIH